MTPESIRYLRRVLLSWYCSSRRDLPWRHTKDPYRIWVSEVMLQQTRVAAVIAYYHRFLERFPNVESLAEASVDDVLALWSGLGYYRRARHLKRAAEIVVGQHGGVVPDDEKLLTRLPGVGCYTAGAVLSIAYGKRTPALDGNVFRVIARFFALEGTWSSAADKEHFRSIAASLVPKGRPGDFNQALMEWGALVCTPASPACPRCPTRRRCAALRQGRVDELPTGRVRPETVHVSLALYVLFDRRGSLLLRKRPEEGVLAGLWELPERLPRGIGSGERVGSFRHSILQRRYEIDVFRVVSSKEIGPFDRSYRWVAREGLASYPLTTMAKKGIRLAARDLGPGTDAG